MITLSRFISIKGQSIKSRNEVSWITLFLTWAENENKNRIGWIGITLAVHGCFLTPLAAMTVMVTTYNFSMFMAVIGAMALSLVTNLAALPTRITIPVFFLSIAIDIVIMAISIASVT